MFTIKHLWVHVATPATAEAGGPFIVAAEVSGEPRPDGKDWTVLARPSDGRALAWRRLPAITTASS